MPTKAQNNAAFASMPPKPMPCDPVEVALLALAACNFAAYRTWAIVDFKGGGYSRAVNALQSVRTGPPVAYVPVPAKVRARVYTASPTFASLRPYLEGPNGEVYRHVSCEVYATTCGDYAGGWFIWALRDAAAFGQELSAWGDLTYIDGLLAAVKRGD